MKKPKERLGEKAVPFRGALALPGAEYGAAVAMPAFYQTSILPEQVS